MFLKNMAIGGTGGYGKLIVSIGGGNTTQQKNLGN
jgi:hypothetical protein